MLAELIMAGSAGSLATSVFFFSYFKIKGISCFSGKISSTESKSDKIIGKKNEQEKEAVQPLSHFLKQIDDIKNDKKYVNFSLYRVESSIKENNFDDFAKYVKDFNNHIRAIGMYSLMNMNESIKSIYLNRVDFNNNVYSIRFNDFEYFIYVSQNRITDLYEIKDVMLEIQEINDKIVQARKIKVEYSKLDEENSEILETIETKISNGEEKKSSIYTFISEFAKGKIENQKIEKSCEIFNKALAIEL